MDMPRRTFLEAAAAVCLAPNLAGAAAPAGLPKRAFGKTGLQVSILGFGSGSRFLMYKEEDKALEALNRAIDLGVTYIDTAHSYGNGLSEERIGKVLAKRRGEVVLATKIGARTRDEGMKQIELSLKRLQTDRLDVLHIHALSGLPDLEAIEKPNGVLNALYEAREQKLARAIGITCHASPEALKLALERHDFDATQMALNAALARMVDAKGGMKATATPVGSFEQIALPVAVRKKMGIIAMKVFGQEQIVGTAPIEKLMAYSLSLPVSLTSLGMPKLEFITQNVEIARNVKPLSDAERKAIHDGIDQEKKVAMADFFRDHRDA